MKVINVKNLIIGAGPAGIAVAGRMRQKSIDFHIIERSQKVANSWHNHYDRLHLHTVKSLSQLPFMDFPSDFPKYVPKAKLIEYYNSFVAKHNIVPEFGLSAQSIRQHESGWEVSVKDNLTYHANNVTVATGVNCIPKKANWKGLEEFKGQIIHSSVYKNANPFAGKSVLVIGLGNSGAEIALDLAEASVATFASVRSPLSIVPRDLNGRSVQETSRVLAKFPFGIGDWLGNQIRKIYIGDLSKYGIEAEPTPPAKLLRTTGKTPLIDIGTIQAVREGKIIIYPGIDRFSSDTVHFTDGRAIQADVIINATGYTPGLETMIPGITEILDQNGLPKVLSPNGKFKGLHFIGFNNYVLGGILGTIRTDSEYIVDRIAGE